MLKHVGGKGGLRALARAHMRNLPSPEALSPNIEEGAVNQSTSGIARPQLRRPAAPAPSAILDPTPLLSARL